MIQPRSDRRAAVIGHPISHSLSPVLHSAAYRALGLDWTYEAIDVTSDRVVDFVLDLDDRWAGLSVTAPLKQSIRPALTSLSPTAVEVGAVNTVVWQEVGGQRRPTGHNTDVMGIVQALAEVPGSDGAAAMSVVGAGGTAAAVLVAARQMGIPSVAVAARRSDAARDLIAAQPMSPAVAVPWTDLSDVLSAPIVVVTLPGDAAATLTHQVPPHPGILLDVTYSPWPTTLAAAWQAAGGQVVSGHRMLLWQAVAQVRLMTGLDAPVGVMSEALDRALGR